MHPLLHLVCQGLVCVDRCYTFLRRARDRGWCRFTRLEDMVLRIIGGLLRPCSVLDLGLWCCPYAYCGDSSAVGFAVARRIFDPATVLDLTRHKERWRFFWKPAGASLR